MDIPVKVGLQDGEDERVALSRKEPRKELERRQSESHGQNPDFISHEAQTAPRNPHAIEISELVPPPGRIAGDGFLDFAFGPSVDVIGHGAVPYPAVNAI